MYVEESGSVRPFTLSDYAASRLVRVALTFLMLLRSERVTISPGRVAGHWSVALPAASTVDQLVAEVLS